MISIIVIIALLAIAIMIARKEPLISFCIIWFFGNLAIESSVIGLELVFEHRNYLPTMFGILAIVALVFRYSKHALPAAIILSLVGALLCMWTFQRNRVWADEISLYRDTAVKSPGKARPQNNLGAALSRREQYEEAIKQYRDSCYAAVVRQQTVSGGFKDQTRLCRCPLQPGICPGQNRQIG